MADNNIFDGCPDPFSVAELIKGERINWSEKKDEYDTIAECLGITKKGFMQNASTLLNPQISTNAKGNFVVISEEDAEIRLDSLLKKFARPQSKKSTKISNLEQRRKDVVKFLLHKQVSDEAKKKVLYDDDLSSPTSEDDFYLPVGLKWRDKGYFFNETVHWRDVCQNGIGDCYFLSALCSIALVNPFLIKNVTALRGKWGKKTGRIAKYAPWHAIDFYVPNSSQYESSQAWSDKKKTVQTIVVSEDVLVDKDGLNYGASGPKEKSYRINGGKLPSKKSSKDPCWPAVYEKAYAKFLEKCTSDYPYMLSRNAANNCGVRVPLINGGKAAAAMKELLHTEKVTVKDLSSLDCDAIYEIAEKAHFRPSCAAIHRKTKVINGEKISCGKDGTEEDYLNIGLHIGHSYSLLFAITKNSKKYVVLRNPHGRNPKQLKKNPKVYHKSWFIRSGFNLMNSYSGWMDVFMELEGSNDPYNSDGLFLLEVDEFKRLFHDVTFYSGPDLSYGSTNLVPEDPVLKVKFKNDYVKPVKVRIQSQDPKTGNISTKTITWALGYKESIMIDLSEKGIKDRSKVRIVVLVNNETNYSRYFYYHSKASKTINFNYCPETR
ncbi:hypothetical protein [uncultured Fibrobacter sp.]|uniref:hypothetical protein n=1 Tax=uncultured Fibrobacter sp. TaxID=261512 RepID=UPI0025D85A81|nr:hypothetical protein [uncultured Fibrobacter sp.]